MTNHARTERGGRQPTVWYLAAGYKLPAGIEAYLLHYATALREQGFETRILVFEPLPRTQHRYLRALEERRIPILSIDSLSRPGALLKTAALWAPWAAYTLASRRLPRIGSLYRWVLKHEAVRRLDGMIRERRPDIVHVKGRVIAEAWGILPVERSVYQHALSGTVDPSWEPLEVEEFRRFAARAARIFAPGRGVAETLAREFRIERPIVPIFTMAPDEVGSDNVAYLQSEPAPSTLRFGILCRFTEQKGISFLLEALRMYRDRYGDVDFTFAGGGRLERDIRTFADAWRLGGVRVRDVPSAVEVLRDIDVFVHPGIDDAMPVSIVEALMCGRPCIGTRVGGVPDLVRDGTEGWLIEPGSAQAIFEAMCGVAGLDAETLRGFQRRARARYEQACTPAVVGAIVAEQYRGILREQSRPSSDSTHDPSHATRQP